MVYHMGQAAVPIVTLTQKVNDGKYHPIKFVRHGANAELLVVRDRATKSPIGKISLLIIIVL